MSASNQDVPSPLATRKYEDVNLHGEIIQQRPKPDEPQPCQFAEGSDTEQCHENKQDDRRKYETVGPECEITLISGQQCPKPDEPPPRQFAEGSDKEQCHEKQDDGRKYETVGPECENILISGQQRSKPDKPPPCQFAERSDTEQCHEKQDDGRKYETVGPECENILISGQQRLKPDNSPPRQFAEGSDTEQCHENKQDDGRKYETVGPECENILISGQQCPKPDKPPPRQFAETKGSDTEQSPQKRYVPPPLPARQYEDVALECDIVLISGLQRPKPDEPPPRQFAETKESDTENPPKEQADEKYKDADEDDGSESVPHGSGSERTSAPQYLDMGDHVVVFPEQNDGQVSDTSYTAEQSNRDKDSATPAPRCCQKFRGMS
ncbi:hypothetical protein Bbelb_249720 [Branchiostoma belcheri]|nr:hypothetical protein Bbelb_249720 [Branchiostoma belcheri]